MLMTILMAAERPISSVCFDAATVQEWPETLRATLLADSILEKAPLDWQQGVTCNICGETTCTGIPAVPKFQDDEVTIEEFVVACPNGYAAGAMPVESAQTYRPNHEGLARWLMTQLDTNLHLPESLLNGRLWQLGNISTNGQTIPCFLAIGANRRDAKEVFGKASVQRKMVNALILTPTLMRESSLFRSGNIVSLDDLMRIDDEERLSVNLAALFSFVPPHETSAVQPLQKAIDCIETPVGTLWHEVLIRFESTSYVDIFVRGEHCGRRTFQGMGFADGRTISESSPVPFASDNWEYFLRLARLGETFTTAEWAQNKPSDYDDVKQWKKKINRLLELVFSDIADGHPLSFDPRERKHERRFQVEQTTDFDRQWRRKFLPTRKEATKHDPE